MKTNTKDKNLSKQTRKACKSMRELRKNGRGKLWSITKEA